MPMNKVFKKSGAYALLRSTCSLPVSVYGLRRVRPVTCKLVTCNDAPSCNCLVYEWRSGTFLQSGLYGVYLIYGMDYGMD